ncbi:MAG: hypothetical protein OXJ38_06490, partial [Gammaproteobacteria bacterium]|nr:hypothetical protein [Gammaproteobacteria bacterium]
MVSVTSAGFDIPPPDAVPDTVTVLSGASTSSSTAVSVTVPVLDVVPAAIVKVVPDWVTGASLGIDIVTVTAALDIPSSVAVTVLTFADPLSSIFVGVSIRLTSGVSCMGVR